jgi:hypothetical protein
MSDITIIDLTPIMIDCFLCGSHDYDRQGLAVYEDEILPDDWPGEWFAKSCCRECFAAWKEGVIKPHMSFAEARRAVKK